MFELFEGINDFLSSLPWWMVAVGTLAVVSLLRGKVKVSMHVAPGQPRSFNDHVQAAMKPVSFEATSSHKVTGDISQMRRPSGVKTGLLETSFSFEGADALEFQRLITERRKVEAIKFLRERSELDLKDAKNIVDMMCS